MGRMSSLLRYLRFLVFTIFLSGTVVLTIIFLCDTHISRISSPAIHEELTEVSPHYVALVPGCSPVTGDGSGNLYFSHRITAAAEAFHAGKCRYLLVSGDNSRKEYNEPEAMKQALVSRGIPPSRIYKDHAGFRTLDSILRAKKIFGQNRILVISQKFHNERAVYIGRYHGLTVSGYNAKDVESFGGIRTKLREKLARVKTQIDLRITKAEPKYLGRPVEIGTEAARRRFS